MGKFALGVLRHSVVLVSAFLLPLSTAAQQQLADSKPAAKPQIHWQQGPTTATLGSNAQIKVPIGYRITDAEGTRALLEQMGNPTSGDEVGLLTPIPAKDAKGGDWFVLFEFENVGYVSDSDKSKLDPDAILAGIKKGTEADNEIRKQKGWIPFHITDWAKQPFYDDQTHNLTWATLGHEEIDPAKADKTKSPQDDQTINYAVRLLGRHGTMNVDLVLSPADLPTTVPLFNEIMRGFSYTNGNLYAEFTKGDKVAGYGLTALIAGGAAAAAVKTGLLTKLLAAGAAFWKFILIGLAAVGRFFKQILESIKGMFSKKKKDGNQPIEESRPYGHDDN